MQTSNLIYGNCCVLSPEGILMFRCNTKKVNWYLNRGLASIVSDDPLTIKLNFTPNGLGNHNKGYGLSKMHNKCVNCGTEEGLTKHHVVPISYRKFFSEEIKSHNFHDVLPMCVECHEKYERKADEYKKELASKYDAPIDGVIINRSDVPIKYIKMALALIKDSKIPSRRRSDMRNKIKSQFNLKRLTKKKIKKISEIKSTIVKKTHGEVVVSKISDIPLFIESWRTHFVQNNECNHLPENWNINYKL